MGTDGLIELDEECWVTLAKYNLVLATVFGAIAIVARTSMVDSGPLVVENTAFALLFGAIQTYAWLSA